MAIRSVFDACTVNADEAFVWRRTGTGKNGRPILAPDKKHAYSKGARFEVSANEKLSADDKGDGVIHADDDRTFYKLRADDGFIRVNEIAKVFLKDVYTVKDGDSLSEIAKHYYKNGDAAHYMAIFNANTNILKKPGDITAEQKLIIPEL